MKDWCVVADDRAVRLIINILHNEGLVCVADDRAVCWCVVTLMIITILYDEGLVCGCRSSCRGTDHKCPV